MTTRTVQPGRSAQPPEDAPDLLPARPQAVLESRNAGDKSAPRGFSWDDAHVRIHDLSNGWFYLEAGTLFERELDSDGNEEQSRPHGLFTQPADAVAYLQALLAPSK